MGPDGQPDEEDQISEAPQDTNVAKIIKARAWDALGLLFNGEVWVIENTTGKTCILCGSPNHVFASCQADNQRRQQITASFEHIKKAIEAHPDTIASQATSPAPRPPRGERASGSDDRMDVESVASSGRRPKAKARPRRSPQQREIEQSGGIFVVRYDSGGSNLSRAVHRRRGDYNYVCGENISEIGFASHDAVLDCIQTSSSPGDISIPQRGDPSLYQRGPSGAYENPAYDHIAEGVYGGVLEKLPQRGVQLCHPAWDNIVIAKPPREYTWHAKESAKAALKFLQKDLRHHIGRADKAIFLDRACRSPIMTIKRDEGGWVNLEGLLSCDLLWCHHERKVGYALPTRDQDARRREMQNRLQLLMDGSFINYCDRDSKLRLQFLGIRLTPGPNPTGIRAGERPFSSNLVDMETMYQELQRNRETQHLRVEHLEQTANWIEPWAIRASSGHTRSRSTVMELDPSKFALSASMSLLKQIQGAYHATEIYNLYTIMTEGIKTGSDLIDQRRTSGRLHSYWGVFPPWDPRNRVTRNRSRIDQRTPMVTLYIPIIDLITESGAIMCARIVPLSTC